MDSLPKNTNDIIYSRMKVVHPTENHNFQSFQSNLISEPNDPVKKTK